MLAAITRAGRAGLLQARAFAGGAAAARSAAAADAASLGADFDLTEEQQQIQHVAETFAREELAPYRWPPGARAQGSGRATALLAAAAADDDVPPQPLLPLRLVRAAPACAAAPSGTRSTSSPSTR